MGESTAPGIKLFVDDVRPCPAGWALARTVREATDALDAGGVSELSLDYFIGEGEGGTFLPVAHHVTMMPRARRPRRVHLHTVSEAGAAKLAAVLMDAVDDVVRG